MKIGTIDINKICNGSVDVSKIYIGTTETYSSNIPNNEIWYTSTDGNIVTPYSSSVFGANIVSNTYSGGKGIIKFDGDVTSIGEMAFRWKDKLLTITLPESVTSIGYQAFALASSLSSINIPRTVISIDNMSGLRNAPLTSLTICQDNISYTFEGCGTLQNVEIKNATSVPNNMFSGCTGLTQVIIPSSVTSIGQFAFSNCNSLSNITIPNSVTSIGNQAFRQCSSLRSITIPNGVPTIGTYTFYNCTSLTSITIPDSVSSIGESAFYYCTNLSNITIPNSVTNIGNDAFNKCYSLSSITFGSGLTYIGGWAFQHCISLSSVTIPASVTTIYAYAFDSCGTLSRVICNSTTPPDLGSNAFNYNASGRLIYVPLESVSTYKSATNWSNYGSDIQSIYTPIVCTQLNISGDNVSSNETVAPIHFTGITNGQDIVQGSVSGITVISAGTSSSFDANTGSSSVQRTVTFNYLGATASTTITQSGFSQNAIIYYRTYYDTQTSPNSGADFGANLVANTYDSNGGKLTFNGDVLYVGSNAFSWNIRLVSITIPSSVTSIGDNAFSSCSSLSSITIPNSVTSIGEASFSNCNSLSSITVPSNVEYIRSIAFYNCYEMKAIYIEAIYPPSIQGDTFQDTTCPIYVPATSVDNYMEATNWSEYADRIEPIPQTNKQIWYKTSDHEIIWNIADDISTNDYVDSIGFCIASSDNEIKFTGNFMGQSYNRLTEIRFPSSIEQIGRYCYNNSPNLINVYCYATTPPTLGDGTFEYSGLQHIYVPWESVNAYKSATNWSNYANIIEGILPNYVVIYSVNDGQKIDFEAEGYNDPEHWGAYISTHSFNGTKGILEFDGDVTKIGEYIFSGKNITSVQMSNTVTSIGNQAFSYCSSLSSITLSENVTTIANFAFQDCENISSVEIPQTITEIGNNAFNSCYNLSSITCKALIPPTLGWSVFIGNADDRIIYVPANSIDAYKEAENWSDYADYIQPIP